MNITYNLKEITGCGTTSNLGYSYWITIVLNGVTIYATPLGSPIVGDGNVMIAPVDFVSDSGLIS